MHIMAEGQVWYDKGESRLYMYYGRFNAIKYNYWE